MKNSLLILILLTAAAIAGAARLNPKKVPQAVKTAFQNAYPKAEDIKWEKEGANFEVNFELNEEESSVVLNAEGKILETEIEIKVSDLPATVSDYIKTNYPGKKIKEASKISDDTGLVMFEAEIKGMDLLFDKEGKFIRENKK
jgi:hypothetical protein